MMKDRNVLQLIWFEFLTHPPRLPDGMLSGERGIRAGRYFFATRGRSHRFRRRVIGSMRGT